MKIKIITLKEFIETPWNERWNETATEEDYWELKERKKKSLLLGETEEKVNKLGCEPYRR